MRWDGMENVWMQALEGVASPSTSELGQLYPIHDHLIQGNIQGDIRWVLGEKQMEPRNNIIVEILV